MVHNARMDEQSGANWHRAEDADVGGEVVAQIKRLANDQSWRATRALYQASAYHGYPLSSLCAGANVTHSTDGSRETSADYQIVKSVIDMAKANIASKQRPKCVFSSKGGDYGQRIRARKLTKYVEASLHQRHGQYQNAWELTEQVFKDSCLWEAGVIKVTTSVTDRRVNYERKFSYNFFVDEHDAHSGRPRALFEIWECDKRVLIAEYPEAEESIRQAARWSARDELMNASTATKADSNLVPVYEAWSLPIGDEPGRHVLAVDTPNGGVLVDEDYEHPNFPIVKMVYEPSLAGFWGEPLVDQIIGPQARANEGFNSCSDNARLNAHGVIWVPRGANVKESDIESNDGVVIVEYDGPIPPRYDQPPPFNPAQFQHAQFNRSLCFELPGINEMASQGRKEAGVDAAVAIREVNDMGAVRTLPKSRGYENAFVALGELTIQATKDLEQQLKDTGKSGGVSVAFPDDGFLDEIKWSDVKMDRDMYKIQPEAASSAADRLSGRRQTVEELSASGAISPEANKRLRLQKAPDTEALTKREQAQERLMERIIGSIEDASEDTQQTDQPPDPLMNLPLAIGQMGEAYLEMLADGAPEHVTRLARNWIVEADELIKPPPAPPADPMAGPPTDPAMGGAPPMGPPPEMMPGAPMPPGL